MAGFGQVAPTSTASGSSIPQRNEFHLSGKSFFSFNGSNFKAQNPRGPDARSSHANIENGLDNDVKFRMIVRRIGAGLENLGNTCFLNSVLQCLTYTEPLVAYLLSGKHQKSCHVVGFCALCAIQNHVIRALQSTGSILAPKDLVTNLRRISRNFKNARQEDAHEYMVHLLESMHKCCLPSGVPYESPNAYEKSLVHKIFGGSLRSQVKCMECSYCSDKFDPFLDLSLEIVKADSLHKALSHFTAAEQLDGGERQYMCQQCKQKVRAVKQLTIDKAPFVLTVHLKRFGSHISGQKIDKKVQFGPILNLKPYVSGSNEGELKYTLYGVLVHAGWSTHSGHYYCFVRTSSGIWYSLDDNRVRQVSEKTVLEQKAYMLFYVRDGINFGAGNIASAIQSQKMVPTSTPSYATSYKYMSIDKSVNATAQKEKEVSDQKKKEKEVATSAAHKEKEAASATAQKDKALTTATAQKDKAVENGLCQGSQNKLDVKSDLGAEKEKVGSSTIKKRSVEKDAEGRHKSSSPAKKIRGTDDSSDLAQHSLLSTHSTKKILSKEDSLLKPDSKDLSQSSTETEGKDLAMKSNMQISGYPSKFNVCDPTTDNVGPQAVQPITGDTSGDKIMKTDLLVSGAKPSEQPADIVVDMVQTKTLKKAGGTSEQTATVQLVENDCSTGISNGAVMRIDGLISKSSFQKPKKKAVKCNKVHSMHLGTRILYGASLSVQKRKRHKKIKEKQKCGAENLTDEKSGPSTSHPTAAIEVSSKITKKRPRGGLKRSSSDHVKHDRISAREDFVSELNRRTASDNIVLAGDDQRLKSAEMRLQTGGQMSHVTDSMNTNKAADKRTKYLKRTAVEICNGVELPSSQIVEVHETASVSIGYVADSWDEEYDRGKRKKVRVSKSTFGGPNPFQKIATKAEKLKKGKRKQYNLANQPFRI